ncbi:MAG: DUF1850 domain-containing protein [Rhodobacteraceae bacterium]|nr:MAG: DUF1850 domain-containing protein [Paracoccaceae bacterium]
MTAALALALPAGAEPFLEISVEGSVLRTLPLPEEQEICLRWAHSVTGGKVADCFENRAGQLVLTRSYLHDFAAGLGEIEGRGRLTSAPEGGYWIEDMDEPLPDNLLRLRIGATRVGHTLSSGDIDIPLSELAPGAQAILTLSAE